MRAAEGTAAAAAAATASASGVITKNSKKIVRQLAVLLGMLP